MKTTILVSTSLIIHKMLKPKKMMLNQAENYHNTKWVMLSLHMTIKMFIDVPLSTSNNS